MRKLEQLEQRLEAEELMHKEEVQMLSASKQIRYVNVRLASTQTDLIRHEHSQMLARSIEITEADESDLAFEFSRAIFSVLNSTRMAALDRAPLKDGQSNKEEKHSREENEAGSDDEGDSLRRSDSSSMPSKLLLDGSDESAAADALAVRDEQRGVEWVRVHWCKQRSLHRVDYELTFRLHEVFTFQDLKDNICSHLQLCEDVASLEIFCADRNRGWPDDAIVMAELRKGELFGTVPNAQVSKPPIVQLRPVPPIVKLVNTHEHEQSQERELRHDIAQKAETARRAAHYLRSVPLASNHSRHAQSLVFRGVWHVAFTVLFTISISYGNSRGYHTVSAVRNALTARFSTQPVRASTLPCAKLMNTPLDSDTADITPYYGLTLQQIRTAQGVRAWLRGALVDALAPRCSYDARLVRSSLNASGQIGFYLNMITPLRLQQTRYAQPAGCAERLSVQNYPANARRDGSPYPPCGTVHEQDTQPYGDKASHGFTYTPPQTAEQSHVNEAPMYQYTGDFGSYGPGGFVFDVWAAVDYRSQITDLLAKGWIDGWTESVAAHLQLVNAQTGCLVIATALFEFSPAGAVAPSLSIQEFCKPSGAPAYSSNSIQLFDFDYFASFDVLVLVISGIYVLRVCFLLGKNTLRHFDPSSRLHSRMTSVAFVQDAILGAVLLAYLSSVVVIWSRHASFLNMLRSKRYARLPSALATRMDRITTNLTSGEMSARLSQEDVHLALGTLHNAFHLSMPWDGRPWGLEVLDLHSPQPDFVSFRSFADASIHVCGLRSLVLLVATMKAMRYLQAWRPLASRYAGIVQNVPYITRFFLIVVHFHVCFTLQANLIFGPELIEFQTVASSFLQLLQFLTGKIAVAYKLIELDERSGGFVGQLFLLLFIVILVLSGSSLIISVLAEGWSNATEVLRRQRETKHRLRALDRFTKQALELELLKRPMLEVPELVIGTHDRVQTCSE